MTRRGSKRSRAKQASLVGARLRRGLLWVVVCAVLAGAAVVLLGQLDEIRGISPDRLVYVYRVHGCLCAFAWKASLEQAGLTVRMRESESLKFVRARLHTPRPLRGCHVAQYLDYFVEGHVSPAVLRRLAEESPAALGVAAVEPEYGSAAETHAPQSFTDTVLIFDARGQSHPWSRSTRAEKHPP